MRKVTLSACTSLLLAISMTAFGQSDAEMKAWQAYMTPGKPHEMLAKMNGTWTGEVTNWMAPGAPPVKSNTVAENKMIMGGRYQISNFSGSFSGMPFEGMNLLAFDNAKKVFISTWVDNLGTGVMSLEGPWDEASKTATLSGKVVDPSTGKEVMVRETFKVVDENTHTLSMYTTGADGKEFQSLEIKLARKK